METFETKTITEEIKVLKQVVCNSCGKDITTPDIDYECIGGAHLDVKFGYGSSKDGSAVKCDLCDDCVDKITSAFVIKPEWYNYF